MPSYCAVVNCNKNAAKAKDQGTRFFRIPSAIGKDRKVSEILKRRQQAWINAIRREDWTESLTKYGRVCSRHFHSGEPAPLKDENHPDWVPSVSMGYDLSQSNSHAYNRYERLQNRLQNVPSSSVGDSPVIEADDNEVVSPEINVENALEQIHRLKTELSFLKLEMEYLKEHDDIVLYYTGFPNYSYFENIFRICEPYLVESKLTKFQQLLMTVMKLRLNLQYTDLAHRFQCHRTTVARTFERVIDVLYCRLKEFIIWPSRDDIQLNMPPCFKNVFGNRTTVIIDCFEVMIQKPSNLAASVKTWSHYKHHHTMKFLIGISPTGVIMFISNAYGGRASDKFITEHSGFLNHLNPGDLVIADRGFTINDSVNLYCAEVVYPTFLNQRKQLSAVETEMSRKLASVRIHIERVIGLLRRKYRILADVFPIQTLKKKDEDYSLIDKVVVVTAVFINFCPGIIPLE